jgi:Transposase DDE domain
MESGDPRGFDAGKKVKGRRRHALVDTDGRALVLQVHPVSVQDRDGAGPLLQASRDLFSFIERVSADTAYAAERVANATRIVVLRDSKFFFTQYHAGKVNITLHSVSISFLFYGLTVKSVPLVLIGLFIFDEMGHAYNYFFVRSGPSIRSPNDSYQLLYASLIMPVLLKLFGWF